MLIKVDAAGRVSVPSGRWRTPGTNKAPPRIFRRVGLPASYRVETATTPARRNQYAGLSRTWRRFLKLKRIPRIKSKKNFDLTA